MLRSLTEDQYYSLLPLPSAQFPRVIEIIDNPSRTMSITRLMHTKSQGKSSMGINKSSSKEPLTCYLDYNCDSTQIVGFIYVCV